MTTDGHNENFQGVASRIFDFKKFITIQHKLRHLEIQLILYILWVWNLKEPPLENDNFSKFIIWGTC